MKAVSTKKTLLASVFAMLLCVSMFVGSTFAWFTDSATTNVNTIQAGSLKVELLGADGKSPLGDSLKWVKAAGAEDEDVLWEPGCSYNLEGFRIKNAGNLALKYKVVISGLTGSAKLLEVIDFTVSVDGDGLVARDGESTVETVKDLNGFEGKLAANAITGVITITGKMQETAGNEYKDLSIEDIKITVAASQDNIESDSNGSDYDKDADYPEVLAIASEDKLKEVLDSDDVNGKTIKLYDDVVSTESLAVTGKDVAFDLNGSNLAVTSIKANNSTIVIKDSSENGDGVVSTTGAAGVINAADSDVTIDGGKFVSNYEKSGSSDFARVITARNSNLTINDGYFENTSAKGSYNYLIEAPSYSKTEKTTITVNGGEYVSHGNYGYIVKSDSDANVDVVINGGKFTTDGSYGYLTNVKGNVVVNDCEFVATGNHTVFDIPENSTVTVKGGTYSVNEKAYTDTSLAGLIFHRKTNGWTNVKGTLLVDPVNPVKVNQPTYSGFIAAGATQSEKGEDGFYTISK